MSCQNSLYVLQALVIVNLLACPFNLFFFLMHKEKKAEGEGSEEKREMWKKVLIFKEVPTYYAMEDSWRENTFV